MNYQLTYGAREDFFNASDYIAEHSLRASLRWENKMLQIFEHLSQWPQTGGLRPEYAPAPMRFWIVDDYLVLYDPTATPLLILAIIHGAQDIIPLVARRVTSYQNEPDEQS